jgi:hypothetical protein
MKLSSKGAACLLSILLSAGAVAAAGATPGRNRSVALQRPGPAARQAAPGVPAAAVRGFDYLQDGGFEAGSPNPFWSESSTNFGSPLCTVVTCGTGGGTGPNSGDWWAWFGGIAALEEGSVSQTVAFPDNGVALVGFFVENTSCSGDFHDFVELTIDGTSLWQRDATDPTCGAVGYEPVVVDASAYADGGSHVVAFHSIINDFTTISNFFIDDVEIVSLLIFEDGFESGDASAWSAVSP